MHDPTPHETPPLVFQPARPIPAFGLAAPPSFARALRQKGLIKPVVTSGDESADAGEWISVAAVFEAHLRRQAMEQAFAVLRGDEV